MKTIPVIALLFLFSFPVAAEDQTSFIYTKTLLKIVPHTTPQVLEPANKMPKNEGMIDPATLMPSLKRVTKEFTVEVRTPAFLKQTDFISHQPFTDKEGMLILVDPPALAELGPTRMITTADILFVDQDGIIIKIAPELKLSALTEIISSDKPIHAFVYLKAGEVSASDIQLGDRIENSYFKTHPVVLQ